MSLVRRGATLMFLMTIAVICSANQSIARPVQAEDLFKLSFVSGAQISHDGKWVAFVVSKMNGPKNTYHSNIWLADAASGKVAQLTRGDSDEGPQWSPDDRWIAFSSGRSEKGQIFRISLAGGEAERLTNLPNGADSPVWSNDGSRIAFQSSTKNPKRKAQIDWHAAGFSPSDEQQTSDVRILDVLHFEDNGAGETWTHHRHVWVMGADGSNQKQLTSGTQWSEAALTWAPDDKQIYFNTYRAFDPYLFRSDVYAIPLARRRNA